MKKDQYVLYNFPPADTAGFDALAELTLDMGSSCNHAADELRCRLAPALWELTPMP